jgi:phosphocarrier protein
LANKEIEIINKLGLHARAAAKLVALASKFTSEVQLRKNNQEVNAKSIMGVMMLAASQGTKLELVVNGEDEEDALTAIIELINDRFGEGE